MEAGSRALGGSSSSTTVLRCRSFKASVKDYTGKRILASHSSNHSDVSGTVNGYSLYAPARSTHPPPPRRVASLEQGLLELGRGPQAAQAGGHQEAGSPPLLHVPILPGLVGHLAEDLILEPGVGYSLLHNEIPKDGFLSALEEFLLLKP